MARVARGGPQIIPRRDDWIAGDPNPWTSIASPEHFALHRVERIMASHDPTTQVAETVPSTPMRPPFMTASRHSAVLVPLFVGPAGETRLILTRRSARLRSHAHQVAFPGGRLDHGETAVEAALRETHEEIGLPPDRVRIIGQLENLSTVASDSSITPFVGVVDGELPLLVPSAREVERIFDVSLAELTDPDCYHEEIWAFDDGTFPVWFFEVEGDTIWGATARMIRRLLDLLILSP